MNESKLESHESHLPDGFRRPAGWWVVKNFSAASDHPSRCAYVHVFPHRDDRTKQMTDATLRQALNQLGWGGKYSPHATRTTGSTRLNELGFSSDWIERQLAHAEANSVRRTYNQADYLVSRARMMQQWADMLDVWRTGATVLPLRTALAA